jgi:hypothetical protein
VVGKARLERDGDLGVLVLDDPPLNLFGQEPVGARRLAANYGQ